jgi:hypothetical protein
MRDYIDDNETRFIRDCYETDNKEPANVHELYSKKQAGGWKEGISEEKYVRHLVRYLSFLSLPSEDIIEEVSEVEKRFNYLAEKWKTETGVFSTTFHKVVNDSYLEIIFDGKDFLPFILKDLEKGGTAHWHTALRIITKENPVPIEDLSKMKKVREAWISWGKNTNKI